MRAGFAGGLYGSLNGEVSSLCVQVSLIVGFAGDSMDPWGTFGCARGAHKGAQGRACGHCWASGRGMPLGDPGSNIWGCQH